MISNKKSGQSERALANEKDFKVGDDLFAYKNKKSIYTMPTRHSSNSGTPGTFRCSNSGIILSFSIFSSIS